MKNRQEKKASKEEHEQFLLDCRNMTLYLLYKKHQFKYAANFDEEVLNKYHKAYVKLVHSFGDYSGSVVRTYVKSIMDSTKSSDDKYAEYLSYIDEQVVQYNKVHEINKHKQIKM